MHEIRHEVAEQRIVVEGAAERGDHGRLLARLHAVDVELAHAPEATAAPFPAAAPRSLGGRLTAP